MGREGEAGAVKAAPTPIAKLPPEEERALVDRLRRGDAAAPDDLRPGEGRLLRLRGRKTAVYRDADGRVHALSPACSHMGCHVAWNPAEQSWDCPCHGSRFSGDGTVIQGPAT